MSSEKQVALSDAAERSSALQLATRTLHRASCMCPPGSDFQQLRMLSAWWECACWADGVDLQEHVPL